ncbi:MAG: CoA pyrophosphatase [Gemmatimonadetes bacterium]|nr:CoA pyrophosphatase [Gemmatimonadota bacterium]MBI3568533.1 CoA pyrophosphatase [Gemmatimonadota bacterium]
MLSHSHPRISRIAERVRAHQPTLAGRDGTYWEAAVAIVMRPTASGDVEMLFIKRAIRDGDPWSGQIALPGGKYDPADPSLEHTAVRETQEEVAIDLRTQGEVFGALDELRPRNPLLPPVIVRPFVASVEPGVAVVPSEEVAGHFWAPLDRILDPAATKDTKILVRGFTMRRDAIHFEGHVIWGMTQIILASFAELAR